MKLFYAFSYGTASEGKGKPAGKVQLAENGSCTGQIHGARTAANGIMLAYYLKKPCLRKQSKLFIQHHPCTNLASKRQSEGIPVGLLVGDHSWPYSKTAGIMKGTLFYLVNQLAAHLEVMNANG